MTGITAGGGFRSHGESEWSSLSRERGDVFVSFSHRAMGIGFAGCFISRVSTV